MKWTDALADDWDDVPADPPRLNRDEIEMEWVEDGFVLTPEAAAGTAARRATSLFSTVACKVGNVTADRDRELPAPTEAPGIPDPSESPDSESPEL